MVEADTKRKLFTITVVIILIIAGIYTFNYLVKETYFALHPEALEEYTTTLTVSKAPALNEEFTITWKSEYKYKDEFKTAECTQMQQLILPESIILIDGELRNIKNPSDEIYYSWTLKPLETGTHYVKFGYCYHANASLVQNESLDYTEVSEYPGDYTLYFLCLEVQENSGEILVQDKLFFTNYSVSGNIDYSEDSINPTYSFEKGSFCRINISVNSTFDMSNCVWKFNARAESSRNEYITPQTGSVNLTKGMNYFNYSIFVYNLTSEYQNQDIIVSFYIESSEGWPVGIHPDIGSYPIVRHPSVSFELRPVD